MAVWVDASIFALACNAVMPGLVPGIHVLSPLQATKTRMAGTFSVKTRFALLPGHDDNN